MGGGIMNAMPREQFGIGSSIKKAVKKVTRGVKDIVSSDAGKAALLAGGAYLTLGGGMPQFLRGRGLGFGASGPQLPGFLTSMFSNKGKDSAIKSFLGDKGAVGLGILGLSTLAGLSAADREEIEEADPTERGEIVKEKLRQSLSRLGYSGQELETKVAEGVSEYFGGAGGYAYGGRIKKALGDTASDNAMQAAGIEGLPIRQNPKGVKELDLRDNGGFIPPVGIKEKEDDIPAMLSNNEFVFTADAVRGMGDGDVDLGAQRMYDMMKKLEEGGRV